MAPLLDQLLLPQKLARRALADLARVADSLVSAAVTLEGIREDLSQLREALGPMSDDIDGLRQSFDRSNDELQALREAMAPEQRGIREAIEGFPFAGGR